MNDARQFSETDLSLFKLNIWTLRLQLTVNIIYMWLKKKSIYNERADLIQSSIFKVTGTYYTVHIVRIKSIIRQTRGIWMQYCVKHTCCSTKWHFILPEQHEIQNSFFLNLRRVPVLLSYTHDAFIAFTRIRFLVDLIFNINIYARAWTFSFLRALNRYICKLSLLIVHVCENVLLRIIT